MHDDTPLNEARQALKVYEETGVEPPIPVYDDDRNAYGVWGCVFQKHKPIWIKINVIENHVAANASLRRYKSEPCDAMMGAIGDLTQAMLEHYLVGHDGPSSKEWDETLKQTLLLAAQAWVSVFIKDRTLFLNAWQDANDHHRKFFPAEADRMDELINSFR